jgi:hypothetical protein
MTWTSLPCRPLTVCPATAKSVARRQQAVSLAILISMRYHDSAAEPPTPSAPTGSCSLKPLTRDHCEEGPLDHGLYEYMKLVVATSRETHIQNHSKRRAANDYSVALTNFISDNPRRPSPDRLYAKRLGLGLLTLLVLWEGLLRQCAEV